MSPDPCQSEPHLVNKADVREGKKEKKDGDDT